METVIFEYFALACRRNRSQIDFSKLLERIYIEVAGEIEIKVRRRLEALAIESAHLVEVGHIIVGRLINLHAGIVVVDRR